MSTIEIIIDSLWDSILDHLNCKVVLAVEHSLSSIKGEEILETFYILALEL